MILLTNILVKENKSSKFKLSNGVFDDNRIEQVFKYSNNLLNVIDIDCGDETKNLVKDLNDSDRSVFMTDVQKFYKAAILHINKKMYGRRSLKYF